MSTMRQERALRESSPLPVIKLWGILLVPLQGEVKDDLADRISYEVLRAIYETEVEGVIIDITGIMWLLDSHICSMLANLGASAKLMGAETIICGMSAEIAQTLQTMGVELENVRSTLSAEEAFAQLGVKPLRPVQNRDDSIDHANEGEGGEG
jgi:rsbT antagonist protein RsbS